MLFQPSVPLFSNHFSSWKKHTFTTFKSVYRILLLSNWVRDKMPITTRSKSASMRSKYGMEQVFVENEVQQVKLLDSVNDDHEVVTVELDEAMDLEVFASMLKASLASWRSQCKRGVRIKVPIELVNLVEAAVKEGFWFHHAEPKYLMLAFWFPEGAHTLPANASHRVEVSAFVMNNKREVLVVKEKSGILTGVWKIPTGVVDEGVDICAAAMRGVKEKTAIDTEFVEVLAFRQSHKAFFGKSDIFFVCMLRPLSFDIEKQESEIEDAQWMPWNEYVAQTVVQTHELMKPLVEIYKAKEAETYFGFSPVPLASELPEQKSYLYLNDRDLKGSKVPVVQEKSCILTGVSKNPTGVVVEGEDIYPAAMREVKEETAMDTEKKELKVEDLLKSPNDESYEASSRIIPNKI